MRAFQVLVASFCLLGGLYLLIYAPPFFLPDRWDPSRGWQLDGPEARLLGAGLLSCAAAGLGFLQQRYYRSDGGRPDARWHRRHFLLIVATLAFISTALLRATPGPNPDYRPPAARP